MREICLDTETTGLDPTQGHKVIEIACIELRDRVKTSNHFHVYVNPRRDVPQEAFNVHGISTEFLQDKPIFDHVAHKFLDFVGDSNIIAHNAAFDVKFLNYELDLLGLGPLKKENIIDSLAIARRKFPGSPASLDALCRRFNIDLSKRTKHNALVDTELLCAVYIELMGGDQKGFSFDQSQSPSNDNQEAIQTSKKQVIASRNFKISDEEQALHKKFIMDNIPDNLWGYKE